jgi:hypothetical protein
MSKTGKSYYNKIITEACKKIPCYHEYLAKYHETRVDDDPTGILTK